jgi:hypothetical protein
MWENHKTRDQYVLRLPVIFSDVLIIATREHNTLSLAFTEAESTAMRASQGEATKYKVQCEARLLSVRKQKALNT